jgi:hypothetical protein
VEAISSGDRIYIGLDRVGNSVWAGAYGLSSEASLRLGLDPSYSGLISGTSSGLTYAAFTGAFAPRINSIIEFLKQKVYRSKTNE